MCQCSMHLIKRKIIVHSKILLLSANLGDTYSTSHAKLERKHNLLIAEVRTGKREASVVST